jgi:microcystin-dependent protein
MDEAYIGEIRPVSFNFAPKNWALCNGQTMQINQNQALFALLGTTYGGNGVTTFNLPNLQSRVPVGVGQGPGLANYSLGQIGGQEGVTLNATQLGGHTHTITGTIQAAPGNDDASPAGSYPGGNGLGMYTSGSKNTTMGAVTPGTTDAQGGNGAHDNRMPYFALTYAICLNGYFPSRG